MYSVSEDYKLQIKQPHVKRTISGKIGSVPFTDEDIVNDKFYVSNQCSESGEIKLGSVFTAALECTFRDGLMENASWKGMKIIVSEGLLLDSGNVEYVPLGEFTVDEATYAEDGIEITAYDAMLAFEKDITIDTTYGTPYELTQLACNTCGVNIETTSGQMALFPNGTEQLSLYEENDIETWRDFLFWIGQTCGGFWTINRSGALELRKFGMTAIDAVRSELRFKDSKFSDFITEYSGISYTDVNAKSNVYFGENSKLVYNLGTNPFIQYGSDSDKERLCTNILNALKEIEYVPFSVNMLNGPVYDLGDVIQFTGGRTKSGRKYCIMLYDYDFKRYHVEGFGSNPATANARSKLDKQLQGVRNGVRSEEIVFYQFTNAQAINISSAEKKTIADIRYTSLSKKIAIFQLEALLDVTAQNQAVAKVNYILNDVEISGYHPTETWIDGKHILHLLYYLSAESNIMQRLTVELEMSGGSVMIDQNNVHCSIYGQGLAATDKWDGTFDVKDVITIMELTDPEGIEGMGLNSAVEILPMVPSAVLCMDEIAVMELTDPEGIEGMGLTDAAELII